MRQLLKICRRMIPPVKHTSSAQRNASIPVARVIEKSSIVWNFPPPIRARTGHKPCKNCGVSPRIVHCSQNFLRDFVILPKHRTDFALPRYTRAERRKICAISAVVFCPIFPLSFSAEVWYTVYISPARRHPVYGVDFSHSKQNRGSARP